MVEDNINLGAAPYHDRFDPNKSRNKVLFRPDRPLQQAELNELQSIAEHNLRRLGDSIFVDGAIQTGMAFSFNKEGGTITIEDGLIYLSGKVRPFYKQSITFTGEGTEKIGVRVVKRIIDHNEDPTLLDQTQGVESHLSAGADRLEEFVELTHNDNSTPTIYEFVDGNLFIEPDRPEFSLINDILAQRTHEESGSYQVEGFNLWTEPNEEDVNKINLVVDSGIAYVLGYRIHKSTPTRIPLNKSQDFQEVLRETHTYDTVTRKFKVGSSSVKEVSRVIARVESPAGGVNITKGSMDGRDAIPSEYTNIDRDTTILWTKSPEMVYRYGTDYRIVEENGIQYVDWDTGLNGSEPATGLSYFITFEYDRVMKEGQDYHVETTMWEDEKGWDTVVNFGGMTGLKPKSEGTISVNYQYYLGRMDILVLDRTGRFHVIEGQPDRLHQAAEPEHNDPNALQIGTILVYPNSNAADAVNNGTVRLRMKDLQRMKSRLEDVEYNQAIQQLESEAKVAEDPLELRGIFADAFTDFSRMDSNLSTISYSFDDASITLPINTPAEQMRRPNINLNQSTASTWGRLVTAPFIEIPEIVQPLASEPWNINPYAVYNKMGVLRLTPESDNWIEEERVTLYEEDEVSTRINRWWGHQRPGDPFGKLSDFNRHLVDNTSLHGGIAWGSSLNSIKQVEGTMISTSQETREKVIEYMRQIEIEFHASNLLPMSNNLALTFDGHKVPIIPTGNTVAGTTDGTVRSNAQGEATGRFTIPSGVRVGTREVVLSNEDNQAISTFSAQGTKKIVEDIITKTRVTFTLYDPLAQSFVFPTDRVVTSFDFYFASKSLTDNIIVQVRGLSEGGLPNRTVYAERIVTPDQISISDDASIPTHIALDDPLMARAGENYCVVLITDSNEYTVWVATLGEALIDNPNESVVTQPYVNGVLYSSSNAVSWTVHNESDLKFTVYTAQFREEAIMEFDVMDDLDSDMILLMASYLTPNNTGCEWEVKIVPEEDVGKVSIDTVPWRPLNNYVEQETNVVIGLAKLRAIFKSNRYTSPMLALDDLMFVNFISATEGDYVSKNIDTSEAPYNTIKVAYDAFTPPGTSVTPYYSTDKGQTWKEFTGVPNVRRQSAEYARYEFYERVSSLANNKDLKFKLTLKSETRFKRPRVRRLTATFKDEFDN